MATFAESETALRGSWSPAYWLCHSEGFRAHTAEGRRLGFVEEVVWSADETEVDALIVRRSCERGGTIRIPVGEVLEVCPEASKLIVAATVVDAPLVGEIR
jgi:sporulation protein YlmC with PRC-barrel domain